MKQDDKQYLGIMALILNLGFVSTEASCSKSVDDFLNDESAALAFSSQFSLPLKFSTDLGELTLTIANNTDEENEHYLRPHNLPSPSDFLQFSHLQLVKRVEIMLADKEDERESLLASMQEGNFVSDEVKVACIDYIQGKRRIGVSAEEQDMTPKKTRYLIDNPVYPLKYQQFNFDTWDKYAFPNSVVTIAWHFESKDVPKHYADLNMFQDPVLFYSYLKNNLREFIKVKAKEADEKKFNAIRAYMYI